MNIKKTFIDSLKDELGDNDYFITADLGYGLLDDIKNKLGKRFINVGISEQTMISMAAGLALSGHRVFTYTISPFYLRALEQIKLDIWGQKLWDRVIMIGSGNDKYTYDNFGLSHHLLKEDIEIFSKYAKVLVVDKDVDVKEAINKYNIIFLPR